MNLQFNKFPKDFVWVYIEQKWELSWEHTTKSVSDKWYKTSVVNYNIRGGLIHKLLLSINV